MQATVCSATSAPCSHASRPPGGRLLRAASLQRAAEAFLRQMVSLGGVADSEARRLHAAQANIDYVTAFMEKWGSAVAITGGRRGVCVWCLGCTLLLTMWMGSQTLAWAAHLAGRRHAPPPRRRAAAAAACAARRDELQPQRADVAGLCAARAGAGAGRGPPGRDGGRRPHRCAGAGALRLWLWLCTLRPCPSGARRHRLCLLGPDCAFLGPTVPANHTCHAQPASSRRAVAPRARADGGRRWPRPPHARPPAGPRRRPPGAGGRTRRQACRGGGPRGGTGAHAAGRRRRRHRAGGGGRGAGPREAGPGNGRWSRVWVWVCVWVWFWVGCGGVGPRGRESIPSPSTASLLPCLLHAQVERCVSEAVQTLRLKSMADGALALLGGGADHWPPVVDRCRCGGRKTCAAVVLCAHASCLKPTLIASRQCCTPEGPPWSRRSRSRPAPSASPRCSC
jgi:hypothetical protein